MFSNSEELFPCIGFGLVELEKSTPCISFLGIFSMMLEISSQLTSKCYIYLESDRAHVLVFIKCGLHLALLNEQLIYIHYTIHHVVFWFPT